MSESQELRNILSEPNDTVHWESWEQLMEEGYEHLGWKTVAVEEGGESRWSRRMNVITKSPTGRFYQWYWERGLTEYQENYYPSHEAPVEVALKERTIVEKYWEKVDTEQPV